MIFDDIQDQAHESEHHKKFIISNAGFLAATRSPTYSPGPAELSEGLTTDADLSDDEEALPDTIACYVFSLDESKSPFNPVAGYWFGTGNSSQYPGHHGVDVLLPVGNFENSTSTASSGFVYARQGYFAFDRTHGQFWIHARHKGIRVDDRPLAAGSRELLRKRVRVSVGPHRFIFEFKVSDEKSHQTDLRRHFAANHHQQYLNEVTSATPSANDVQIDGWVLHGVVGASVASVIYAATHTRSGEVVAVKRLRFGSSAKKAEKEDELYDDILESIRDNRYNAFVMQKRSVLSNQRPHTSANEVYLLWKPLARMGDFSGFSNIGKWRKTSEAVKKILFVQIALGLSALHDAGWIHRDLKPANLGIVELGDAPMAIIIDEGSACRKKPEGCAPRIGTCGTVGYLAPELENASVSPSYDSKVDIWSLGAVAYFVFVAGRIPWSVSFNMFVPIRDARQPSLHVFREIHADLLRQPRTSMKSLIGAMLAENPLERPSIQDVLAHAAVREVRTAVDARLEASKSTGQKRGQAALLSGHPRH